MTGVSLSTQRASLSGLVTDDVLGDADALGRAYAFAAWSCLTEPGDGTAGALVAERGVREALRVIDSGDAADDPTLRAGLARWRPRRAAVDDAFDSARRARVRLITPDDAAWPRSLSDLGPHAPHCLWVRGDPAVLTRHARSVSLVGARAATGYGEHVTGELATHLARRGVVIVSGGAYGIDGMAHRAALGAAGSTVAFLAGGVDRAYPSGHADLLARITRDGGAVAAEVPCGTSPTKWRFLQRNRLIAAQGTATVVVEAGWRSGSLNTAGHAAAMGRPLGAVPGPITSAASAGCHRLLREYDARCITSVDDVVELLGDEVDPREPRGSGARTDDSTRILDAVSHRTPRDIEDIARRGGFAVGDAQAHLALMELEGLVRRAPEGWRRA
ncbi:DNA-processing protein DprA [Microbacterium sp. EYE_5]|uniref:DNA-processing protein DprA n=1 Tax=unclassified Microbacterium TaxID=2609290 RepID=UPI00200394D1|nr:MULTISPECIES: DNA-processing protein DprA [unclassified Microbacterium]MCK6080856.1 DNA-processing protein DprA [Microbacterium sp. EYE_382]MCK6086127.1 DNA-processing protein DprA [Microbacterium sp. EYE_384]MCK6124375.1 DNA-processing protein DprA [Microbacterium sp. EYE_80]MCK6127284.1 DNA-processing protein DprA [Microbacterium sp. EYE_79]MCK6141811.1 DNA-processing protein DprA [Microbacterium sp. EYE_39]